MNIVPVAFVSCLATALAATLPARAAGEGLDGNGLKAVCAVPTESAPGRFCEGYVLGYMDGFRNSLAATTVGAKFCFPKSFTTGDWLEVVKKYLADSSNDLSGGVDIVVGRALYKAYGCRTSN